MIERDKINKVFLTGYMGSGKSFVGSKLADYINWEFIDLDDYISKSESKTIAEIFKLDGEPYFRKLEFNAISSITDLDKPTVVALGGGSYVQENCRKLIQANQHSAAVYLKYPVDVLAQRLCSEKSKRPLLANATDLEDHINQHLAGRSEFYEEADLIIEDEPDVKNIIEIIHSFISYKN